MKNVKLTAAEKRAAFKEKFLHGDMMVLCGAFDGITARLVQEVGFDGAYMGGQATAATLLGVPDIGLVTADEQVKHASDLASCIELPFLMDADTGYGNALNVRRTIRMLEDAGVCGAHFEDQVTPKRCGGMAGVQLESEEVFLDKIRILVEYRRDPNFLIIARTDAGSVYGLDEAIRRMNLAADAGADAAFYGHILKNIDEIRRVCRETKIPVVYCLMEFSRDVCFSLDELREAGVRAVVWPNGLLMRWFKAAKDLMIQFKESGDPKSFYDELMPVDDFNEILGIRDWNPSGMFK